MVDSRRKIQAPLKESSFCVLSSLGPAHPPLAPKAAAVTNSVTFHDFPFQAPWGQSSFYTLTNNALIYKIFFKKAQQQTTAGLGLKN